jgi:hypothetical protein
VEGGGRGVTATSDLLVAAPSKGVEGWSGRSLLLPPPPPGIVRGSTVHRGGQGEILFWRRGVPAVMGVSSELAFHKAENNARI